MPELCSYDLRSAGHCAYAAAWLVCQSGTERPVCTLHVGPVLSTVAVATVYPLDLTELGNAAHLVTFRRHGPPAPVAGLVAA